MSWFFVLLFSLQVQAGEKLFLYKVSAKNVDSYIFGTVHYGLSLKELDPKISKLHRQTKNHFYETLYNPYRVREFLRTGKDPSNLFRSGVFVAATESGQKPLTKSEQVAVIRLGVPPAIADSMSRQDCDLIYYRKYLYQGKSLDMELLHHTFMMGKAPLALDTPKVRAQAKAADEDSGLDFACDIGQNILADPEQPKTMDQYLAGLYSDYKKGNEMAFADLTAGVKFRNEAWLKQLLPYLKKDPTFVTIGVYHLHGPDGLLTMLKQHGFSITRL